MQREHGSMHRATGLPAEGPGGAQYERYPWGYEASPCWESAGAYWPGRMGVLPVAEVELAFLEGEASSVREYLEEIERRIGELEKKETETA
jgi:hypothetical protein